jgi:hypothetical protein
MRKLGVLFIIFCFEIGFSQKNTSEFVSIEWESNSLVKTSKDANIIVPVVKGQSLDENQMPVYFKAWDIQNNQEVESYAIENLQYQVITRSDYKDLKIDKIPVEFSSRLETTLARAKSSLQLELTPLVYKNGILRRVISFRINYTLKNAAKTFKGVRSKTVLNSVLASGSWFKFSIDTTGVFKLSRSFLQELGINVNGINPKNIKIYGNGGRMLPYLNSDFRYNSLQENAIEVVGEDDGVFDSSDYILFYAVGPNDWLNETSRESVRHRKNIFSDDSFYFITVGDTAGKRVGSQMQIAGPSVIQFNTFDDYTFYEKDAVNLFTVGQQWFGEDFSFNDSQSFYIPFNNLSNAEALKVRVRGVAESSLTSSMLVKVNGSDLFNINYPAVQQGSLTHAFARENNENVNLSGDGVTVQVDYSNNGNPSANAHLDYIEIIGTKNLIANNNQFGFRNFESLNINGIVAYQIENAANINAVWDVTDFLNPEKIENEALGSTFNFKANGGRLGRYRILNESDYFSPKALNTSAVENQNLHALQDVDYVIITRDFLMNSADKLANYHRDKGLIVEVVDLEKIYNEFSSGSADITAIRDFTKHLYDGASTAQNKIKYLCLFGDATYDYKDRISGNNNIVPVFEAYESFNLASSYVTDDYYGMMDENEGLLTSFDRQDVVTGRIVVDNLQDADAVLNKMLNYYSTNSLGDWRNLVTLVADDINKAGEEVLQGNMELIADAIKAQKPLLNVKKIYADAFVQEVTSGGARYPDVNVEIANTVDNGTLIVDYFGHGGEGGWAAERILDVPQIQAYNNFNTLPLFITITCEFTKFDNPSRKTAGEYVLWNTNGGAVSLITTTREVYINVGRAINNELIKYLLSFNGEDYSIAEAMMHVKNKFTTSQRLFIYPIGDPAMKLALPKEDVKITHMNGIDISQSLDTIKALSYITFDGIVTNSSGVILSDFNGEVSATVYDKEILKTTLDNNNFGIKMDFDALESKIFRGRATVENGKFSFDFVAPRDLRIAFGKGKLSFYADNNITEKAGYSFDVTIGGINANAPEDNEGPKIQLFLNDESFVDGGNTNESPILVAILEDENGINTSITAVDHDIVATLDGDRANSFILNDYYQTELNLYSKGKLKFPLRELEPGMHTLELCAWDTYNNSSCATLSFIVVNDMELVLDHVLNYPNPFVNYTEFWFNHNKPNEPLEVQVQIFTVSGKLVKTINKSVQSDGNLSRSITWDGRDDFGDKIGKGVYVYKLNVKSSLSNVRAEKYEKLVILQ